MSDLSRDKLIALVRKALDSHVLSDRTSQLETLVDEFLGPHGWRRIVHQFPTASELSSDVDRIQEAAIGVETAIKAIARLTKQGNYELNTDDEVRPHHKLAPLAGIVELLKTKEALWTKRRQRRGHRPIDSRGIYLIEWVVNAYRILTGDRATEVRAKALAVELFAFVNHGDAKSAEYRLREAVREHGALELPYEARRARRAHLNKRRGKKFGQAEKVNVSG